MLSKITTGSLRDDTNHLDILLIIFIDVFYIARRKASVGSFTLKGFVGRLDGWKKAVETGFEGTANTLFSVRTRSDGGDEPGHELYRMTNG